MNGVDQIKQLKEAGFSDEDIGTWTATTKKELFDAGFGQGEVDTYFGEPPFDPTPVKQLVQENIKKATKPEGESTEPKPVNSFMDALEFGLQSSVSGLMVRGEKPNKTLTEDAPMASRVVAGMGQLAGDLPFMVTGAVVGGANPVTGTAGAFALPAGMRQILMDKYEKGEATSFGDFWERASGAIIETAKGWITGAATGAVGKAVQAAPIASPTAKAVATISSEVATMVTVGKALEGEIPKAQDFLDAAVVICGVKRAMNGAAKLRKIYGETGVKPDDLVADMEKDPTILQDVLADNVEIPGSYQAIDVEPVVVKADRLTTKDLPEYAQGAIMSEQRARQTNDGVDAHLVDAEWEKKTLPIGELFEANRTLFTGDKFVHRGSMTEGPIVLDRDNTILDGNNRVYEAIRRGETQIEAFRPATGGAGGGQEPPKPPTPPKPPVEAGGAEPLYVKHIEPEKSAKQKVLDKISIGGKEVKEDKLTFDSLYTKVVDDLHPVAKMVKEARDGKELTTANDPYQLARLSRGSFGKANQMLEYGTYDFKSYENNGASLKEILKPVHKDLNGLRAYAVSKRTLELSGRDINSGVDAWASKEVVRNGQEKYEPILKELVAYQNRVSKYLKDAGVITDEAYAAMKEANKNYVPFFRVMDDGGPGGPKVGGGVRNPIKAIKGSDREIIDPLESIIKNTYTYVALAERNQVFSKFVELAKSTGEPGKYIKKVAPPVREIKLHEDEIQALFDEFLTVKKKSTVERKETSKTTTGDGAADSKAFTMVRERVAEALKARGFSDGEAKQMIGRLMAKEASSSTVEKVMTEIRKTEYVPEIDIRLPNDVASIFRTVREPLKDNEIGFFNNGKYEVYEVDKDIAAAFKGMDAESANFLVKILAIPAKTLRAGAVLSPDFMGRNILRDQTMAFALSKSGYLPFIDLTRGFLSIVRKDEAFQNWLKGGGAQSTYAAMDRQYMQDSIEALTKNTGVGSRAWNVVKSPLDLLRALSELAENSTRLGVFKQAMKHGVAEKATIQEAAMVAREGTLDFQRIGSKMRAANMIATFLNAHVQGLDRVARGFKDDPFGMTMRAGISITVPSLLLWMANRDDPRYQEIPRWQKDLFWIVMTDDTIYRIPKPHELGLVFGTVPERLLENFIADNPDAAKDIEKSLLNAFIPNMIPTAATPLIEQFANRSLFTGSPTIPSGLEKLLPEYQYTEYTTETSKAIGQIMGSFPGLTKRAISDEEPLIGGVARALSSPILMENYLRAWTGGLGMYVLQLADKGLREAGVVPDPVKPAKTLADLPVIKAFVTRYPSASAQSIQDFYDEFYAKQKVYNTVMEMAKQGDVASMERARAVDPSAMAQLDGIRDVLTTHSQLVRMIHKNPQYTAEEKRQLIDTTYFRMIEIAQEGKRALRQIEQALTR